MFPGIRTIYDFFYLCTDKLRCNMNVIVKASDFGFAEAVLH